MPAHVPTQSGGREVTAVPFDDRLAERLGGQWLVGDWDGLTEYDLVNLGAHPDRAKLSLFVATAHAQKGAIVEARRIIDQSIAWGVSKRDIARFLIAAVHSRLGRAAAFKGDPSRARRHLEATSLPEFPHHNGRLLTQSRVDDQIRALQSEVAQATLQQPTVELPSGTESFRSYIDRSLEAKRDELRQEFQNSVDSRIKALAPNPYAHNRTLTGELNASLRKFGESALQRPGLKPHYLDYLAGRSLQLERMCTGRLATTVQDVLTRLLVCECVEGEHLGILEIGALYGISLAILYNHAVTRYRSVHVTCLDPFDGYYGQALDIHLGQPVNDLTFVRNMELARVPVDHYTIIKHYSTAPEAKAKAAALRFNLLIIDGDHSYEGVKFDFEHYFPLLAEGGYVIFDDCNAKEWPDVQRFVEEDLPRYPNLSWLGSFSRTGVARKITRTP